MIAANDDTPLSLPDALSLSLVTVQPRELDERYWRLHARCAVGTITDDERAELDLIQAAKERDYHG